MPPRHHCLAAALAALVAVTTVPQAGSCAEAPPDASASSFVTYRYVDPATGLEAFRLLIPKGWQVPTQSYFWTDSPLFLATNPPGSLRFGTLVAQPSDLDGAFTKLILPRFRSDVADLRIVGRENVPELAALAAGTPAPAVDARAEGGKIRVKYREGGPPYFIDYWFVDYVFSFRAREGQLDGLAKTFQTMIFSLRANPQWFAKVLNVKEALARLAIQGIHAVGRMGEIIARTGSQIREDQQRAWEQRQQVQDKIAQNFSDYVRGVDRYQDPNYNPNVGSNLHWNELPRAP
jgi:hypothetical protein